MKSSFHDLINREPASLALIRNACGSPNPIEALANTVSRTSSLPSLARLVHSNLPGVQFSIGDIIAMAGKVAVEMQYPCVKVKWRPGRPSCLGALSASPGSATPDIQTMAALVPHLNRYNLTAEEFAVLLAGSHGIEGGKIISDNFPTTRITNITEYIQRNFNGAAYQQWQVMQRYDAGTPKIPFIYRGSVGFTNIFRSPIDLAIYSSSVNNSTGNVKVTGDPAFASTEAQLRRWTDYSLEFLLQKKFAEVFGQVLEVGFTFPASTAANPNIWYSDFPLSHDAEELVECRSDPLYVETGVRDPVTGTLCIPRGL